MPSTTGPDSKSTDKQQQHLSHGSPLTQEQIVSRRSENGTTVRTFQAKLVTTSQSQWGALVETHCAVNRGVRAASNLLLSMRGGISPQLVSAPLDGDSAPSSDEVAFRRTLLALSYLTVEDTLNAPGDLRIGASKDFADKGALTERLKSELALILRARGVIDEQIAEWLVDCGPALAAATRDDALWVNRALGFDQLQQQCGPTLTSDAVWDLLQHVVGTPREYFDYSGVATESDADRGSSQRAFVENSDKIAIACQRWLGQRFGSGQGLNYERLCSFYENLTESITSARPDDTGEEILNRAAVSAGLTPPDAGKQGMERSSFALDLSRQLELKGLTTRAFTSTVSPLVTQAPLTQEELKAVLEKVTSRLSDARLNIGVKGERPWATAAFTAVTRATGFEYRGPSPRTDTSFGDRDRSQEFSLILGAAGEKVSALQTNLRKAEANRFSASGALRRYEREVNTDSAETGTLLGAIETELGERCKQEGYVIRPRSITGWPELVRLWSIDGTTEERRLEVLRSDLPEVLNSATPPVKLGNTQLFEILAREENRPIWTTSSGETTADTLLEYVRYQEAREKVFRYKVIRFCHADALEHPVFPQIATRGFKAEFGVSSHLSRARPTEASDHDLPGFNRSALPPARTVSIDLFDGAQLSRHHLRWSSSRFFRQIVNGNENDPLAVAVSRITRLGRAAAGVAASAPVYADAKAQLFARVILDRKVLAGISAQLDATRPKLRDVQMIEKLKAVNSTQQKLGAKLMMSAKLTPRGPAHQYGKEHGINLLAPSIHAEFNKQKGLGTLAKRRLSHLPGLRVLGVHFGVGQLALSVWETLSASDASALMNQHGQSEVPADDVPFVALPSLATTTTRAPGPVLRRLGSNTLPDGETAHPAPWAVHRRSTPLLPPGHKEVRLASNKELELMREIATLTELTPRFLTKRPTIVHLMHTACYTVHRALDRQRPIASLAYDLSCVAGQSKSDEARAAFTTALRYWCDLVCKNPATRVEALGQSFDTHIGPYIDKQAWQKLLADHGGKRGKSQKYLAARDALVEPLVKRFADLPNGLTNQARFASGDLAQRWQAKDTAIQRALASARQLIRPSEKFLLESGDRKQGARNHVGGLSQRRLATLTAYKDALQAFDRRPLPSDKHHGSVTRFETFGVSAGRRIQSHIVKLREEYARVMASRIIEAALGLGREPGKAPVHKHNGARSSRDLSRESTFDLSSRHAQTPVIVMENLSNYAPVQTQGRRENVQLRRWLSQRVTELVQQQAEEHGIRVELVSPHRVSLRDSYTFGTGVRVRQVAVADFVRESGPYAVQRDKAGARLEAGVGTHFDRYLLDLMTKWDASTHTWTDVNGRRWTLRGSTCSSAGATAGSAPQAITLPDPAGDLFISENADKSGRLYRNAEINAASNVALLPLCDPAYAGTWSVVPIDAATGRPLESMKGTPFGPELPLVTPPEQPQQRSGSGKKVKAARGAIPKPGKGASSSNVRNAYRNPLEGDGGWKLYAERMAMIEARVVTTLRLMHGLSGD